MEMMLVQMQGQAPILLQAWELLFEQLKPMMLMQELKKQRKKQYFVRLYLTA